MRILEIGKYISVAYAGMLLSEQGHDVIKILANYEPVLKLRNGDKLFDWLNYKKITYKNHNLSVKSLVDKYNIDVVISNVPDISLKHCGKARLVKIKPTCRKRGFDIFAQAQIFSELNFHAPFYIGDTVSGLFAAFLAISTSREYSEVGQGEALQKIIEGELLVDKPLSGWDIESYNMNNKEAKVFYRGKILRQRKWTRNDKLKNLNHNEGRISFERSGKST